MQLKTIHLSYFRNIESATITFNENINVIVGQNGQGKTNLVEAIFVALRGYSFRFSKTADFINFGKPGSHIRGNLISNDLVFDFQTILGEKKKTHFLNKKQVPIYKISHHFPIVLFSPESLSCIKGGADERRQLLDEFLINVNPHYGQILEDYNRVLRSRNKVLKKIAEGAEEGRFNADVLQSLDPIFIQLAIEVTKQRIEGIRLIQSEFSKAANEIFGKFVDISVEYVASSTVVNSYTAEQLEKHLIDRAHQLRNAELSTGTTLIGPHKHDIRFLYDKNDSRIFCSQGQQRALILAFKIAQIVYHKSALKVFPILVLDDVLSELDKERRESLIHFLGKIQTQIFITTTDELHGFDLINGSNGIIRVSAGKFEWTK